MKTPISLGIRPVWSEPSLCAQWAAKDPSFLHGDSEYSDQTGWMPRLIWVFVGCTVTLLVLSCWGSYNMRHDAEAWRECVQVLNIHTYQPMSRSETESMDMSKTKQIYAGQRVAFPLSALVINIWCNIQLLPNLISIQELFKTVCFKWATLPENVSSGVCSR